MVEGLFLELLFVCFCCYSFWLYAENAATDCLQTGAGWFHILLLSGQRVGYNNECLMWTILYSTWLEINLPHLAWSWHLALAHQLSVVAVLSLVMVHFVGTGKVFHAFATNMVIQQSQLLSRVGMIKASSPLMVT
jgi:hypothetical protein